MSKEHTKPATEKESPAPKAPTSAASTLIDKAESSVPAAPLSRMKVKRRLTIDVTNIQKLGQVVMMAQSELYTKEMPSSFDPSGKALARCVDIVDVVTGEPFMLACNTVLASALERAGQPLTGRYFAVRCGDVVAGKRYRRVDVVELQPEE